MIQLRAPQVGRRGEQSSARAVLAGVILLAVTTSASAQFASTYSSGSMGRVLGSTKEAVDKGLEHARWRLGPLRLGPWVELSELSYVDNAYGTATNAVSDVKATITLGLHGYVPFGEKVVLGLVALPSTSYWAQLDQFRGWTYLYGAGLFAYFNRLTVELQATDARQQQQVIIPGFGPPVDASSLAFSGGAEVRLLDRLSVFASASNSQYTYDSPMTEDAPTAQYGYLDRDEQYNRGGLRYRWSDQVAVGVGVLTSKLDYLDSGQRYSNSGKGGMLDVQFGSGPVSLSLTYANMKIRPEEASESLEYNGLLGRSALWYKGGGGWDIAVYGGRTLSFGYALTSVTEDYRYGVNLSFPIGWRFRAGGYLEQGTIIYYGIPGVSTDREDDIRAIQLGVMVPLGGWTLRSNLTRERYTGTVSLAVREVNRLSISLSPPGAFRGWW